MKLARSLLDLQSLRGRIAALASESSIAAKEAKGMVLRPMMIGFEQSSEV